MRKLPKRYIPIIVLIFLMVFTWAEEVIIGEGYFSRYLHLPEHKILRFSIRGIYLLIIFITGHLGLSNLSIKWIKALWVYWYILSVIAAGLRIIFEIYIPQFFINNFWGFLELFYSLSLTAFPYLFLLLLYFLYSNKHIKIIS